MEPGAELLQYALNTLDEVLGCVCPAVSRWELLEEDAPVCVVEQLRALWPSETFASQLTAALIRRGVVEVVDLWWTYGLFMV